MAYVARASLLLPVSAEKAFDRLTDHGSWPRWMPASFRPHGSTVGRLSEGQRFRVKILGLPLPVSCRVSVMRSGAEVTWVGGVKGALFAEHRFLFEPRGPSSVFVDSVETWSGPLAALLRAAIHPGAVKVGREQLAALAAELATATP